MNRFFLVQRIKYYNYLIHTFLTLGNCCLWVNLAQGQPILPTIPNPTKPETLKPLPSLPEALPSEVNPDSAIPLPPEAIPGSILVKRFEIVGNTVLSQAEINRVVKPYTLRHISFIELLEVPQKITQLYVRKGYITSGAVILPQTIKDRVVKIQIIPGTIEEIKVYGLKQLDRQYILSRLAKATQTPLNQQKLLAALQLLQINPLIDNLSAELSTGIAPNSSLLEVTITEADTFSIGLNFDNTKVASIGTFTRQIELNETNFSGLGDRFNLVYSNTDGSNALHNLSYELPINARNSTLKLTHNRAYNEIIQEPFKSLLGIKNETQLYDLSYTQPLYKSIYQAVNIGFNLTRESSQTTYLDDEPFPNEVVAIDETGQTTITTFGFFQDYLQRDEKQIFFLRSHFNLGIDALDSTINENKADSQFVVWRGYSEYLRALSPRTTVSLKSNIQLVNDSLAPIEQFTLGGLFSVRGYPQNILSGDNGIFFSTEISQALIKNQRQKITLELIPFLEFGKVWNTKIELEQSINTLAAIGAGLKLSLGQNLTARIDFGIPLVEIESFGDSLQENGIHFSLKSSL
jgi:hemolysin activation/secretion protein